MNYENKIPNKKAICDTLVEAAETDKDIVVLCSDSRGSASFDAFIEKYPERVIELGIAEQNLVSISAGMAACGKKAYAISPASFLSTRSMEQAKVDVAYSNTNVKLIGISGGISYGALGLTHQSTQDIAVMASIPNMRVYFPSDRFQTKWLIKELLKDEQGAYIRVGRNPIPDLYEENASFELNKASVLKDGTDVAIITCGDMVSYAYLAAEKLAEEGISAAVIDMYCLKPFDSETVIEMAKKCKAIVTVEEHVRQGGLGSQVCQTLCENHPAKVACLTLPDEPTVTGTPLEVYNYYGLGTEGIAAKCREMLGK